MKKIFLLLNFLILTNFVFSQKQNCCDDDSTVICFPAHVGKQILIDLNELDKLRKEIIVCDEQVNQLEQKTLKQEGVINLLEEKDTNNLKIISETETKVSLLKEENNNLNTEIKKLKRRNTLFQIGSGVIIGTLTGIIVFK